jgi:hypothetical protein
VERRADVIAERVFGEPIAYDSRNIQCVGVDGKRQRPRHLPDKKEKLKANPGRWIIDMLTKDDARRLKEWWEGHTGASHRVVRSPSDRRYWAVVREGVPA